MSQNNIQIISAGAGSGKTYTLTHRMLDAISKDVRISGLIATTFTEKAASDLQHKVRELLLQEGMYEKANELSEAMIGTVHSIGVKLLRRFAFEAGVSPEISVLAAEDAQQMFNNAFSAVISKEKIDEIDALVSRLGKHKKEDSDWRKEIRNIVDVARSNDFDAEVLRKSRDNSISSFAAFLPPRSGTTAKQLTDRLKICLGETIELLKNNGDETKTTANAITEMQTIATQLSQHQQLNWYQWAKLAKVKTAVKSLEIIHPLQELLREHEGLSEFQDDINNYITEFFDAAIAVITEFQDYKKRRGLIDYTDMEVLVKKLLLVPSVRTVLQKELDLLLVDEFQDTSPLQLDNFLQLSGLAAKSIWVGDPKQSIYGFRGADPKLMQAIIDQVGVGEGDILKKSYRSRRGLVVAVNAIFTKAFEQIPKELIPLEPPQDPEPEGLTDALMHWHFKSTEGKKIDTKGKFHSCIAHTLRDKLAEGIFVRDKNAKNGVRMANPGDVAILCRTNLDCVEMAGALHGAGLKAAISRIGLVGTTEIELVIACLKYLLQQSDALAVAEILLLSQNKKTADIVSSRLDYLEKLAEEFDNHTWASEDAYIRKINDLRERSRECAPSEMLLLIVEELDLRRIVMTWGDAPQRLANLDLLQKMVLDYEDACNRKNAAASLGGFLLWLDEAANNKKDTQAASESPDSVNVLTYHKSKGLEWPVVICHSLEDNLPNNIWGLRIVSEGNGFDLSKPLENRWLQFWVNPYADQSSKTPLVEKIKESEYQKQVDEDVRQEETRLMYVGMTRASDYMIFPTRKNSPSWLNRVCMGDEDKDSLDPDKNVTDWEWKNEFIPIQTQIFQIESEFEEIEISADTFHYYPERTGRREWPPYFIDAENGNLAGFPELRPYHIHKVKTALKGGNEVDDFRRVKVAFEFHRSLAAQAPAEIQIRILEQILSRNELLPAESEEMLVGLEEFQVFLHTHFQAKQFLKNYPLMCMEGDRKFESHADVFAETENQLLLLKLETYSGEKEAEKAQSLSKWANLARKAVAEQLKTGKQLKVLVHFVASGNFYELR